MLEVSGFGEVEGKHQISSGKGESALWTASGPFESSRNQLPASMRQDRHGLIVRAGTHGLLSASLEPDIPHRKGKIKTIQYNYK